MFTPAMFTPRLSHLRGAAGAALDLTLGLTLAAALSGCVQTTPRFDAHFGEAVQLALARQTIAPGAGANPDPVAGIDGASARNAQDNYRKSFIAVPQAGAFTMGVSGGK
jgi:hypothetical protein